MVPSPRLGDMDHGGGGGGEYWLWVGRRALGGANGVVSEIW